MILKSLCVIILAVCEFGIGARILGIIPTPSYSHQVVFRPIWRELSKRGHDVVVITTDPENNPNLNITEIDISFAYDVWEQLNVVKKFAEFFKSNPMKAFLYLKNATRDICTQELLHPDVQALLKNDTEHFDLLIVEFVFPVMLGFAQRFECPYIGLMSMDLVNAMHSELGNFVHSVLYPDAILPFDGDLTFWQRLISFLYDLISPIIAALSSVLDSNNSDQKFIEDNFGNGLPLPPLFDIKKNVSMVFINADPSFYTRPLGPAVIPIGGGTHLTSAKALPKTYRVLYDSVDLHIIIGKMIHNFQIPVNVVNVIDTIFVRRRIFTRDFNNQLLQQYWSPTGVSVKPNTV